MSAVTCTTSIVRNQEIHWLFAGPAIVRYNRVVKMIYYVSGAYTFAAAEAMAAGMESDVTVKSSNVYPVGGGMWSVSWVVSTIRYVMA